MLFIITVPAVSNTLLKQDYLVNFSGMKQNINLSRRYTVNDKGYTRENFCGFHDESWKFSLLIDFAVKDGDDNYRSKIAKFFQNYDKTFLSCNFCHLPYF